MGLIYVQDNSAAGCGSTQMCSGFSLAQATAAKGMKVGGTPGNQTLTTTLSGQTTNTGAFFQSYSGDPGLATWPAGTWVFRLHVTTGNANLKLHRVLVCRTTAACVNSGAVALTGSIDLVLTTPGIYTATMGGSQSAGNASDMIYVTCEFTSTAKGTNSVQWTNDQNFDSPFPPPAIYFPFWLYGH